MSGLWLKISFTHIPYSTMAPISILVRDAVLSQLFARGDQGDLDCTQTDCDDPYKAKVAAAVIGQFVTTAVKPHKLTGTE